MKIFVVFSIVVTVVDAFLWLCLNAMRLGQNPPVPPLIPLNHFPYWVELELRIKKKKKQIKYEIRSFDSFSCQLN